MKFAEIDFFLLLAVISYFACKSYVDNIIRWFFIRLVQQEVYKVSQLQKVPTFIRTFQRGILSQIKVLQWHILFPVYVVYFFTQSSVLRFQA